MTVSSRPSRGLVAVTRLTFLSSDGSNDKNVKIIVVKKYNLLRVTHTDKEVEAGKY